MLSRLQQDTQIVQDGLTTNVAALLKSLFTVIGIITILFAYSTKITFITIALIFPGTLILPIYSRLSRFSQNKQQEAKGKASANANEAFSNIRTVKAHASEDYSKVLYNDYNEQSFQIGSAQACYYAGMMTFFQWLVSGGYVGVAYFAAKACQNGELSSGNVATYLLYNMQVLMNVNGISNNIDQVMKVQGSFYNMASMMIEQSKLIGYYDKKEITKDQQETTEGKIDLTDIEFSYPTAKDVKILDKINIDVNTNQVVALVG